LYIRIFQMLTQFMNVGLGAEGGRQLLAFRAGSNGGACFVLARNGEPRPAVLIRMRILGAL